MESQRTLQLAIKGRLMVLSIWNQDDFKTKGGKLRCKAEGIVNSDRTERAITTNDERDWRRARG